MSLSVGVSDLPKPLRGPVLVLVSVVILIGIGAAASLGLAAFVRAEAREQATTTTKAVLTEDLNSFKAAAKEAAEAAARQGAEKAVREAVGPLSTALQDLRVKEEGHEREDAANQKRTDEDIRELKQRVR